MSTPRSDQAVSTAIGKPEGPNGGHELPDPLDELMASIDEISTIPQVALHIMEVTNDPEAGAAELKRAMEGDPALSARVLRCVNSAAYALPSRVTNLQVAISYLGFDQIRNLGITACVCDVFKTDEMIGPYRRSALWKHLVSVAICGRMIATRQGLQNFEDAFLAGLLHDIGIILEDQHVHEGFTLMLQRLGQAKALDVLERECLGFDHTSLGSRVAETWNFPDHARAAIRFHHRPENCPLESLKVVQCVEVANFLCTHKGISSVGKKLVCVPQGALEALALRKEDIKVLAADLDHELSLYQHLFNM